MRPILFASIQFRCYALGVRSAVARFQTVVEYGILIECDCANCYKLSYGLVNVPGQTSNDVCGTYIYDNSSIEIVI